MAFSDSMLARRAAQGDAAAFGALYDRHCRRVYTLLRRLCAGDAAAAEDLTQETFLAAHRSLVKWRGTGALGSWLCGIAVNQWRGHCRARSESDWLWDVDELADAAGNTPLDWDSPFQRLAEAESLAALERAVTALPVACRAAFVLVYVERLSYKEAAAQLEIPTGTVQSRLNRAKRLLQASLASEPESAWAAPGLVHPNPMQEGDRNAV